MTVNNSHVFFVHKFFFFFTLLVNTTSVNTFVKFRYTPNESKRQSVPWKEVQQLEKKTPLLRRSFCTAKDDRYRYTLYIKRYSTEHRGRIYF